MTSEFPPKTSREGRRRKRHESTGSSTSARRIVPQFLRPQNYLTNNGSQIYAEAGAVIAVPEMGQMNKVETT
jgi:hypothetical protein